MSRERTHAPLPDELTLFFLAISFPLPSKPINQHCSSRSPNHLFVSSIEASPASHLAVTAFSNETSAVCCRALVFEFRHKHQLQANTQTNRLTNKRNIRAPGIIFGYYRGLIPRLSYDYYISGTPFYYSLSHQPMCGMLIGQSLQGDGAGADGQRIELFANFHRPPPDPRGETHVRVQRRPPVG